MLPEAIQRIRWLKANVEYNTHSNPEDEGLKLTSELLHGDDTKTIDESINHMSMWLTSTNSRVSNYGALMIIGNWEKLVEISQRDGHQKWVVLGLLDTLVIYSPLLDDQFRQKAQEAETMVRSVMSQEPDAIKIDDLDRTDICKCTNLINRYGSENQKIACDKWIESRLDKVSYFTDVFKVEESDAVIADIMQDSNFFGLRRAINKYLDRMGVKLADVEEYWRMPDDITENQKISMIGPTGLYILRNIVTMREVEARNKGLVKKLHKQNGIVHFGSWPIKWLWMQDRITDFSGKAALVTAAVYDYNGGGWDSHETYNAIEEALEVGTEVIIAEVEPARAGSEKKQYQIWKERLEPLVNEKEIELFWVMVHGSKTNFGYAKYGRGDIDSFDFQEDNGGILRQMTEDGLMILASCSTGTKEPDGIGRQISTIAPVRVLGPELPSSYVALRLKRDAERLVVADVSAKSRDNEDVRVNLFRSGELERTY